MVGINTIPSSSDLILISGQEDTNSRNKDWGTMQDTATSDQGLSIHLELIYPKLH